MTEELKPCPFCGGAARLPQETELTDCINVNCIGFNATGTPKQWNTRTPAASTAPREPHKRDEPTAYADPGMVITTNITPPIRRSNAMKGAALNNEELAQKIHDIYQHKNTQSSLCEVRNLLELHRDDTAAAERGKSIPDGYVLVPKEPTHEMVQELACFKPDDNGIYSTEEIKQAYRDMLKEAVKRNPFSRAAPPVETGWRDKEGE